MNKENLCWCGSGKEYANCHQNFDTKLKTIKLRKFKGQVIPTRDIIKNEHDIEGIRKSGVINTGALDAVASQIRAGMSTEEINLIAHNYIVSHGGIPACLDYEGFPKSICVSVNNVVCHGIPDKNTILQDGDIVNVDITTILDGYFSDSSRMFMIGNVKPKAARLVEVARECMELGVAAIKPWGFLGDIGHAVERHAKKNRCSVVTALGGHGVGKAFHEEPFVNHTGSKNTGMLLVPGMVLTVEPMINLGRSDVVIDSNDGWTIYTKDGSLSAQWEKTVLITETGTEILSS